MVTENNISKIIAEHLLQIKAIKLQPSNPFTWASGIKSPIYCDNRKTLSFVNARNDVRDAFVKKVEALFPEVDVIAGVATGAIALGVLVAQAMDKPFVYVRSGAKSHGLGNQVEGYLEEGKKVVVIEDLVSTGGSSLNAVEALREKGANVLGLLAIFTYGFDEAYKRFEEANCPWETLSGYETMLEIAVETNYITQSDVETLQQWRRNPKAWAK
jgi:orotate phosphoribosyltransferase